MKKRKYFMQTTDGAVFITYYPEHHKEYTQLTRAEGEKIYRNQVQKFKAK